MGYREYFSLYTLLLDFTWCLAGPSLFHSNCAPPPVTPGTWASQPCVQTDAEIHCWSCCYWSERAFIFCWFTFLFWCFANAVPFLPSPGHHLNRCATASVSTFQLWVGSIFCLQRHYGKTEEGTSCVSILALFEHEKDRFLIYAFVQLSIFSFFLLLPSLSE